MQSVSIAHTRGTAQIRICTANGGSAGCENDSVPHSCGSLTVYGLKQAKLRLSYARAFPRSAPVDAAGAKRKR
jgi:hypothetical protein